MVDRWGSQDDVASAPDDGVTWRELRRGLWVGRADGEHLGVIERGRRFTFTDAEERSQRFASLSAAQGAATGALPIGPGPGPAPRERTARAPGIAILPPRSIGLLVLAGAVLAATCGVLLLL